MSRHTCLEEMEALKELQLRITRAEKLKVGNRTLGMIIVARLKNTSHSHSEIGEIRAAIEPIIAWKKLSDQQIKLLGSCVRDHRKKERDAQNITNTGIQEQTRIFYNFKKLSLKIRRMIWGHAVSHQILEVDHDVKQRSTFVYPSPGEFANIMLACKEARDVVLFTHFKFPLVANLETAGTIFAPLLNHGLDTLLV